MTRQLRFYHGNWVHSLTTKGRGQVDNTHAFFCNFRRGVGLEVVNTPMTFTARNMDETTQGVRAVRKEEAPRD